MRKPHRQQAAPVERPFLNSGAAERPVILEVDKGVLAPVPAPPNGNGASPPPEIPQFRIAGQSVALAIKPPFAMMLFIDEKSLCLRMGAGRGEYLVPLEGKTIGDMAKALSDIPDMKASLVTRRIGAWPATRLSKLAGVPVYPRECLLLADVVLPVLPRKPSIVMLDPDDAEEFFGVPFPVIRL